MSPPRPWPVCIGLAASAALAQPAPDPRPLWEFGAFAVAGSQQSYPGSAQQVQPALALPFFIYRGPLLRADDGTVGARAFKSASTEVDVGLGLSFGSSAEATDVRRGMPDIGTLVEVGPRLKVDLGPAPADHRAGRWRFALPLRAVFDLNDRLAWKGLSMQPELGWSRRSSSGWSYATAASVVLGSARLADVFYGVAPAYATPERPAYEARGGLVAWRLSLSASRTLSPDWRVFAYARVDSVAGAANRASPLVERRHGASGGIGLSWTWMRSDRPATE